MDLCGLKCQKLELELGRGGRMGHRTWRIICLTEFFEATGKLGTSGKLEQEEIDKNNNEEGLNWQTQR